MFKLRIQRSPLTTDDLYSLSQESLERYTSYRSCIINSIRFRCTLHDNAF